mgnify:CR=1 FL=1|tara:strand:+ start:243 stop:566 length:324 start_codon:yes stop_codon:yes gene_type:complete
MPFSCALCRNEYVFLKSLCTECAFIQHCCDLYTRPVIVDVLKNVMVRDTIKRNYKIKSIKNEGLPVTDNSNDRSYKITKEIKEEDTKTLNKRCLKELKNKLDTIKKD